jgi:hypothetical protein
MSSYNSEETYLAGLSVYKTVDEFGNARYFVQDMHGDFVSEAYDTPELAFAEIDMRRNIA